MKGASDITVSFFVMMFITVLFVGMLWLWFSGEAKAEPPLPAEQHPECTGHSDCYPGLCMSVGGSNVFCGCLDDSQCGQGKCGDDKRCR
jgi:hypothetical protein